MVSSGRDDLVDQILTPLAQLAREQGEADTWVSLFKRGIAEVRACVVDPERGVTDELVTELEGALSAVRSRRELDPVTASVDDPLDGFVDSDDEDLEALLAGIDEDAPEPAESEKPEDRLGTLREPLLPAESGASVQVLMKGELQPGLLSDLIQMFAQNSETGRLVILGEDERGEVFFDRGTIVDAAAAGKSGEEGFYGVMRIQKGRFAYERGVRAPTKRIFRSAQHLIMETLRLHDEMG